MKLIEALKSASAGEIIQNTSLNIEIVILKNDVARILTEDTLDNECFEDTNWRIKNDELL